jgi:hypothetical protein
MAGGSMRLDPQPDARSARPGVPPCLHIFDDSHPEGCRVSVRTPAPTAKVE